MNKRMLELYKQAQIPYTAKDPSNNMPYETTCFSAEKFAELIVRECAKLVEDNMDPQNAWITPKFIKEHFGLDE